MMASLSLVILLFSASAKTRPNKETLPPRYKTWLKEEVAYIIGPQEKEVFAKLQTDRERDVFIEAFWKHRDPTPGTPENEFRKEHDRRINYTNHFFGRGTSKPGWKTDRGEMYIILGEPGDIQRFEGQSQIYPSEIWFYQGKTNLGLPPGFNLVFFQKGGIGEYKLYSPFMDGPQALMRSQYEISAESFESYEKLYNIEPLLAQVSLSLIPGEAGATSGRPSLSSGLLIQKILTSPTKLIEERYARKFLEYKDIVEVEYSTNYISNASLIKVIKEQTGVYFVHYAIEPEKLSVNEFQNKYSTTLKLNGTVSDTEGRLIHQFEKNINLSLDQEQMSTLSYTPFMIRDMFPLIPGNYRISILVKNEVSKEFTSFENKLFIPDEEKTLQMTSLLLGYKMIQKKKEDQRLKPFSFGDKQVYFQPNRTFPKQDNMIVAFQIHGVDSLIREKGEFRFTFFKTEEVFRSITRKFEQYPELPNIIETFSLSDFAPAHYRLQVTLMVDGQEVLSDSEDFDITFSESMVRPWIYSKLLPGLQDPVYSHIKGTQLFNSGKINEAKAFLEEAYRQNPESLDYALSLAQVYFRLTEYGNTESVLSPFLERKETPSYELLYFMGKTYKILGKLDKAINMFDKAVSHYGVNIVLLNELGGCYFQLGKPKEALALWEKSLEIQPDQPQIRKKVENLKEKKS